jgi:hypothetical protein
VKTAGIAPESAPVGRAPARSIATADTTARLAAGLLGWLAAAEKAHIS